MTQIELVLLNFSEVRRRSIKLWESLPKAYYNWKPDETAISAIEMIRHVLQADYGWDIIINRGDMTNYKSPWEGRPFVSVKDEMEFAANHRNRFLESIARFSDEDLQTIEVTHPGNGEKKMLGQYLLRIAYHESVHAGQFLSYLRAMGLDRPSVWD